MSAEDTRKARAELKRITSMDEEEISKKARRMHGAFVAKVGEYLEEHAIANAAGRRLLARNLARRIYASSTFDYNVKVRALAQALHRSARQDDLYPVAHELMREWHARRWKRRIVIGTSVVVAIAATVFLYKGGSAVADELSFYGGPTAQQAVLMAGAVGADAAAVYLVWWVWRSNPAPLLFPTAAKEVRDLLEEGEEVTIEEANLPCLDACARSREGEISFQGHEASSAVSP